MFDSEKAYMRLNCRYVSSAEATNFTANMIKNCRKTCGTCVKGCDRCECMPRAVCTVKLTGCSWWDQAGTAKRAGFCKGSKCTAAELAQWAKTQDKTPGCKRHRDPGPGIMSHFADNLSPGIKLQFTMLQRQLKKMLKCIKQKIAQCAGTCMYLVTP